MAAIVSASVRSARRRACCSPWQAGRQFGRVAEQSVVEVAHRCDVRIDGVGEQLLDLAVADAAGAIARLDGGNRSRVGECTQQGDESAPVGVLRLLRWRGVGDDPPDFPAHDVRFRHERDRVVIGLAHLAAVEAGERRDRLGDERPRLAQHVGPVLGVRSIARSRNPRPRSRGRSAGVPRLTYTPQADPAVLSVSGAGNGRSTHSRVAAATPWRRGCSRRVLCHPSRSGSCAT